MASCKSSALKFNAALRASASALGSSSTHSNRLVSTRAARPLLSHLRHTRASFHTSTRLQVVKPFLLADIGEGITECQLIQWFVQPGARVEQFDKICEVQSDKASVEITSPFDGVIKKLYYEPDDMAITGKPLVDIDIESDISDADKAVLGGESSGGDLPKEEKEQSQPSSEKDSAADRARDAVEDEGVGAQHTPPEPAQSAKEQPQQSSPPRSNTGDKGSLATPAVRHLIREHKLKIEDIQGTGKDGRVLKEDVFKHVEQGGRQQTIEPTTTSVSQPSAAPREDHKVNLTPVQSQMFKTMTKSLNIPHFLYSTGVDMSSLSALRKKLNTAASPDQKLTHLAFILKAVSLAFLQHPLLNAHLSVKDPKKPELTHKGSHNFGVAIDAPSGLLVPVVKNVQNLSVQEIATTLRQLSDKARNNKLAPGDFNGATFTISNIGSVGGGVVAPVISEPQVGILGVGRGKIVPAFDASGALTSREEVTMSWSADHRVVDGAECARCAEKVVTYLEDPAAMMVVMR